MSDFNERVIADFRANGGYVGAPFNSDRLVLLHHVGAKSGEERISPLMSFPDADGWVIVASVVVCFATWYLIYSCIIRLLDRQQRRGAPPALPAA